jgi:hypothetical protein
MSHNGPPREVTVKGVELQLDMIFAGLQTVPAGNTFVVNGKTFLSADLAKEVDSRRALYKSARDLRNQLRAKTREKREKRQEMAAFIKDVKIAATAAFGRQNPELEQFGFPVEKPTPTLTPEEKVLRSARARETREARHTMGAKQRQAIHGEVHEVKLVEEGGDVKSLPTSSRATDGQ